MWTVSANVMNDAETPEEGAATIQSGLEAWYAPQQ
jgi:raffinose/stachyose/melibiose transport system substrate-binding protein